MIFVTKKTIIRDSILYFSQNIVFFFCYLSFVILPSKVEICDVIRSTTIFLILFLHFLFLIEIQWDNISVIVFGQRTNGSIIHTSTTVELG